MILYTLALLIIVVSIVLWRVAKQGGWNKIAPPSLSFALFPIIGLGAQFIALRWASGTERMILFTLSYGLVFWFVIANWKQKPLRVLAAGFWLNLIAILSGGGYMPITPEAMTVLRPETSATQWISGLTRIGSKDIVLKTSESPFWFLGDVFVLGQPIHLATAFSLGDLLILLGFGCMIYSALSPQRVLHEPT